MKICDQTGRIVHDELAELKAKNKWLPEEMALWKQSESDCDTQYTKLMAENIRLRSVWARLDNIIAREELEGSKP